MHIKNIIVGFGEGRMGQNENLPKPEFREGYSDTRF
jgi:hypothetical protein